MRLYETKSSMLFRTWDILVFLIAGFSVSSFAATTATRDLPVTYTPGGIVTVHIDVNVDENVSGVIVKEWLPDDWVVSETMLQSSYPVFYKVENDPENYGQSIHSWVAFGMPVPSFSITYRIWIPASASGDYLFYGKVLTLDNPEGDEISGEIVLKGNIGDINGSGSVDISDVILCLRMAIRLDTPDLEKADLNNDGNVDISDVILVLRIAIGLL